MTKLKIENVRMNYNLRGGHRGHVIVFVDGKRPLNSGDIVGDILWRRTHATPYPKKEILEVVSEKLKELNITPLRISYSKKAGCSACPCSPGYVIYDGYYPGKNRIAIRLKEIEDGSHSELVTDETM